MHLVIDQLDHKLKHKYFNQNTKDEKSHIPHTNKQKLALQMIFL